MLKKTLTAVMLIVLVISTTGCAMEGFSYSMGLDIDKVGTKNTHLTSKKGEKANFVDPPLSNRNTRRAHSTGRPARD